LKFYLETGTVYGFHDLIAEFDEKNMEGEDEE